MGENRANNEDEEPAWPGPVGGSEGEAGSIHRAGVGAFVIAHALADQHLVALDLLPELSIPTSLAAEADEYVDDLVARLSGGGRAFIEAKLGIPFGHSSGNLFSSRKRARIPTTNSVPAAVGQMSTRPAMAADWNEGSCISAPEVGW